MIKELTETSRELSENGQRSGLEVSPLLSRYIVHLPEGGIDMEAFVEHGGRLVGREKLIFSLADWSSLEEAMENLRLERPTLAEQIELLIQMAGDVTTDSPPAARNEAIFAILYCAREVDLIPDDLPVIGFSDDAAVVALALSRNAAFFERFCEDHALDWSALRPDAAE
jgi:uncharacterized membrane protein YkvA (DUF1232 family)